MSGNVRIPFVVQLLLCAVAYTLMVVNGVYGTAGFFTGFYLVHINAIPIAFMGQHSGSFTKQLVFAVVCLGCYVLVRFSNQSAAHIGIAGCCNVLEQLVGVRVLSTLLDLRSSTVQESLRFMNTVFVVSLVLSLVFALIGSCGLSLAGHIPFRRVLLLYFFSHALGNYVGLMTIYILRGVRWSLPRWHRRQWRRHTVDMFLLMIAVLLLNVFRDYGVFKTAAIIAPFPLMSVIAIRHRLPFCMAMEIVLIVIMYTAAFYQRGPFITPDNKLRTLVGLHVLCILSTYMTCSLSVVVRQRESAFEKISRLRDDILYVSTQTSHDIRVPVSHIMSVCEMISQHNYTEQDLEEVQFSCESVKDIMDSWLIMLNSSMTSDAGFLSRLVKDTHTEDFIKRISVYTRRTIVLSLKPLEFKASASVPPRLLLNSNLLYHVLVNLLSNAVKYSEQGTIELRVAFHAERQQLHMEVQDQGKGIDAADFTRIYERFYRVDSHTQSAEGTAASSHGVGLSIVKTLLQKMHGSVQLHSVLGQGSTFTLTVPASVSTVQSSSNSSGKTLQILLAEDNEVCVRLFTRMLAPYAVTVVSDGAEVLPELERHEYDVLLLDGTLPNKSGIQIFNELRSSSSKHSALQIVYIGGGDFTAAPEQNTVMCRKPFGRDELHAAINKAMNTARSSTTSTTTT